jgi:hypothetical protein
MTPKELRDLIASPAGVADNGFDILAELGAMIAAGGEDESPHLKDAREIAIRLLDHRAALGGLEPALDALLRRLGMFPYVAPESLGVRDLLALEAHRPLEMPDEEIVFHRVQAEVYRRLMDGENVVLSAPTSFGKSLVIDGLIASGKYDNVVVVVPTIALIDETRRRLATFAPGYKVITHVSQPLADRNLLILTQERVLELEKLPPVGLFVIDEFYKLSPDRERSDRERTYLLNQAFRRLYRTGAQFTSWARISKR